MQEYLNRWPINRILKREPNNDVAREQEVRKMITMQIEKPKVINKKLAKQYRKTIRIELLASVKGDTWENSSAYRGRTWNEYIQHQTWYGITNRLVWNKEFCSISKLVNDEYKILPPFENYYINQLNRKSCSNQSIANVAAQSLKYRWPWRAWIEEMASFSPAAVERQIVNMLIEIAERLALKNKD